jgi:hydroxylamine reductase
MREDAATAALRDLLLYAWASSNMRRARQLGTKSNDVDVFVIEALFTTVTNVVLAAKVEAMVIKATIKKNAQLV